MRGSAGLYTEPWVVRDSNCRGCKSKTDPDDGDENAKLLGVYSSEERAQERIARCASTPGFQDDRDGFTIGEYEIDKDEWTSGFAESPEFWAESGWTTTEAQVR